MYKRYRGFRDDDGSIQWGSVRQHLRSRCWVAWFRIHNRWMDLRAYLAGACNATTWNEELADYEGGYSHWRCGKRRGHLGNTAVTGHEDGSSGPHRFINYTWGGRGHKTGYAPMPIRNEDNTGWFDTRQVIPFRKLADGRHAVDSRRRSRKRAAMQQTWMENQRAQRRRTGAVRPD